MLLMPDPSTARMDPFTDEPVLNISCDVLEPIDGKPYDRCPRASRSAPRPTSSRPAWATSPTSAPSPSSSSSTA